MRKIVWLAVIAAGVALGQSARPEERTVLLGKVEGVINPVTAQYVDRLVGRAEAQGAAAVVVQIDTPGGLADSTFRITGRFLNSRVPVITYVSPSGARAASAGTFITMAGHVAAMAPATNIGAAHPVDSSGNDIRGDLRRKVENNTVAEAQKIALARGRNAQWAEDAVRKSVSIRNDEAARMRVVDFVASDVADVLHKADGKSVEVAGRPTTLTLAGARVETVEPNLIETFLHVVVNPQIAFLLFTLGTYGLIFELSSPSLVFPGVIGVIAIVIALFALGTLNANAAGVVLLVFALLLFVSEIWVTSHGILTAGGIAALIFGALLLFPASIPTLPGLRLTIHPLVLVSAAAVPAAFAVMIVRGALQMRRVPARNRTQALIGTIGVARSDLAPAGIVHAGGEDWSAYEASRDPRGRRAASGADPQGRRLCAGAHQDLRIGPDGGREDDDVTVPRRAPCARREPVDEIRPPDGIHGAGRTAPRVHARRQHPG